MRMRSPLLVFGFVLATGMAGAATLVEDFENPFPAWKTRWLAQNSNLTNYYEEQNSCYGIDCRGNNPDGLWIADGIPGVDDTFITFAPSFAAAITSLQLDVAGYDSTRLVVFDKDGATLLDTVITLTSGAYTDPGTYATYSVNSINGIGGWRFLQNGGGQVEGNTSIDNVVVDTGGVVIPEPATFALIGTSLTALAILRRCRSK